MLLCRLWLYTTLGIEYRDGYVWHAVWRVQGKLSLGFH